MISLLHISAHVHHLVHTLTCVHAPGSTHACLCECLHSAPSGACAHTPSAALIPLCILSLTHLHRTLTRGHQIRTQKSPKAAPAEVLLCSWADEPAASAPGMASELVTVVREGGVGYPCCAGWGVIQAILGCRVPGMARAPAIPCPWSLASLFVETWWAASTRSPRPLLGGDGQAPAQVAVSAGLGNAGSCFGFVLCAPVRWASAGITPRDHGGPVFSPASLGSKLICFSHWKSIHAYFFTCNENCFHFFLMLKATYEHKTCVCVYIDISIYTYVEIGIYIYISKLSGPF